MEEFGILVPVSAPADDGLSQAPGAVEAAAPDGLAGNRREPALDQVEPRRAGRSEVEVEARMGGQPSFDRRMLVGAVVVVADEVQLQFRVTSANDSKKAMNSRCR